MGRLARSSLRTAVVGGGPAGLFYALLAKQRMPDHEIVVYERNPPDATFGFGVVFSERTLGGFADADPQLYDAMTAAGVSWEDIEVRRRDGTIRCGGQGFSAISRRKLLRLLQERARAVGVELRFEHEIHSDEFTDADLVLAADGVNSGLRWLRAAQFRPRMQTGVARFIWFATRQRFDALTFVFVEDEHGAWGVHAYPFEDGTSTFIVETDESTWRRAGLDQTPDLATGESDLGSLRFCEQLFADHLGDHGLLCNNSKWAQFRTLRCASWVSGNVVLLGDAAHTAHFSVGSGTKMAMEDASALADAIAAADTIPEALSHYERLRRPPVDHIQAAARPSLIWWERFGHLADRDLEQFAFHFLTRSPAVTRDRLRRRDASFVQRVDRWAERALSANHDRVELAVVEAPPSSHDNEADRLLAVLAAQARDRDRELIVGVRAGERTDAVDALLFCDRVVQELSLECAALGFLADDDDAATAILAGRVQIVRPQAATGRASAAHEPQASRLTR